MIASGSGDNHNFNGNGNDNGYSSHPNVSKWNGSSYGNGQSFINTSYGSIDLNSNVNFNLSDPSYSNQFTTSSPLLKDSSDLAGISNANFVRSHLPLPVLVRWSYGVGHVLNDLVASCWFSYLLVFFRTVLLFQSTSAGFLLLIGQVADGMATPVVGFLSDRTESRFGKRRLWILCGSIAVALTFPPIFHAEYLDYFASTNTLRVAYYSFFIVLFQFGWASVQVSHLALVPELTREPPERVFLNSLRSIFTILSNVTVFILAWFFIRSGGSDGSSGEELADGEDVGPNESLGPADVGSFFTLSLCVVAIGSIFSLIFIFGTPAPAPRPRQTARVEWFHWFARLEFYQTAIIYTCTRLLVNVSQTYMPLYLLLSLQAPKSTIASVPLTVFGAGLLSTCMCERLTHKLGSDGLTFIGCLTVLGSCIGIVYLPNDHWQYIYGIACLLGAGTGIVGVSALSLICNLVGESCESGAFVYGSMSFSDKIANGIAIMVAEALCPTPESGGQHLYYRNVMLFAPGGAACLAVVMLGIRMIRGQTSGPCSQDRDTFETNLSSDPATRRGSISSIVNSPESNAHEQTHLLERQA